MDLSPMLPALLEALASAGIGIVAYRHVEGRTEKLYISDGFASHLGLTVGEWHDTPVWNFVAPGQQQTMSHMFQRLLEADRSAPAVIEVTLIHRDGHEVPCELAVGRVPIERGHVLVAVVRELGPQQQTQLSQLEADRLALVGALASGFAHETNNPLTSVLLNLRSLRKQIVTHLADTAQASALRCLEDITTGAERIAANVRALQTLATRSARQTVDLATIVTSALRLAAPTLEPRANVIRQINQVAAVAGEESRFGQAVLAMLLFSSSGFDGETSAISNRIIVAVEERDGLVVVEVSDNGRDLTHEETARAFDPFFRSSVRGAGVGVGLGVARSVAMTHGGEVTLARRDGGGAVITMRLPPAPAHDDRVTRA
jgi:PAS domain S-box-containing protein